ncbi:MAG TPA: helicase, partial [Candidatus Aminicenantes bacterium]|nr:helicase [Candidatus Aminicenantes bacterium]
MSNTTRTDLTFITNEANQTLLDRFNVLIKDTRLFDVLVGYFYTSGFYSLYKSLESTEKIRILIGVSTNKEALNLIKEAQSQSQAQPQLALQFSHAEVKKEFCESLAQEMEKSQDSAVVEEGILKFIEWLKTGKLEIRAYPSQKIHAK